MSSMASQVSLVLCLMAWLGSAGQQPAGTPVRVVEDEALTHVIKRVEPVYPAIAKAAHIEGVVRLQVVVDASGNVSQVRKLDGSSLLIQASIDAVRQWKFSPVLEAHAGSWVTEMSLGFGVLTPAELSDARRDSAVNADFGDADQACRQSLTNPSDSTVPTCRKELSVVLGFPHIERRKAELLMAHQNLGRALMSSGAYGEARLEFNAAIEMARETLGRSDSDYATPFFWRASAEQKLGDAANADGDFKIAEDAMRRAIEELPDMADKYRPKLEKILRVHAAMLQQNGGAEEARPLLAEADSLKVN